MGEIAAVGYDFYQSPVSQASLMVPLWYLGPENMSSQKTFPEKLYRYLEQGELILVVILGASLVAHYLQVQEAKTGLQLSLSGLAVVYFLMAYRPPALQPDGERKGFGELLAQTILPIVLWIGCSVGAIGIMFQLLKMEGARQMLMIHAATGGLGIGLLALLQNKALNSLTPLLYRVIPLLLISVYFLLAS